MATALSSPSNPSTPPYPQFPRLPHTSSASPSIQRNASTSSSRSTTTTSSTSSLAAAPMRPPPSETRTAATSPSQMGNDGQMPAQSTDIPGFSARGLMRNGPRSDMARHGTLPIQPSPGPTSPLALSSSPLQGRSNTLPVQQHSPTTPRAPDAPWSASYGVTSPENPPRVTITSSGPSSPSSPRGRGFASIPSSPIQNKARTLSVSGKSERDLERERRMSQVSNGSSSGSRKPSAKDWVFGEEIGRGSYSTVVRATPASSSVSNVRADREYAVKIMNQQHLIAEKKAKYAVIERDALIRLSQPRSSSVSPTVTSRHIRGASGSSARRKSNASMAGSAKEMANGKERLSIVISDSSSGSGPLSPTLMSGRRPSRSAEPPAVVHERSEESNDRPRSPMMRSRPPSPVKEESSSHGHEDEQPITPARTSYERNDARSSTVSPPDLMKSATPKKRRTSLAPSERSVKTISAGRSMGPAHPGVIRLYSTFNDKMSLYYVLELASNGELLDLIRKNGSLDIESTRHYAAQLIDTIEFMHEREIIHRDLKPENILLDANFRIKVTDFGSAKILGRDTDESENKKRSFVGSADFVSPEVLRNEPAVLASDIWAFGCIVFQLLTGKPPFRGATDYLTFQKILKREFEFPTGFDEDAKSLIDLVLNPDPVSRPSPADIKSHPFFATVDFASLWTCPAPTITPGLTKPIDTLANNDSNSDVWAVFDDEVSDGGFEYDDDGPTERNVDGPQYDGTAAADAVRHDGDDLSQPQYPFQDAGSEGSDLQPPRPSFVDASPKGKWGRGRLGSRGSERTSSSSSTNRHALSGLLESLKLQGGTSMAASNAASKGGSSRNSRTSDRSAELRVLQGGANDPKREAVTASDDKWSSLLLANETIVFTTSILVRAPTSVNLPNFLMPSPKRRQLILTDFPRLFTVKEDTIPPYLSVKSECVFVAHAHTRRGMSRGEVNARVEQGAAGWVLDVQDKGPKGFTVQTTTQMHSYMTDTSELKKEWMGALKRFLD